jgi:hypothetical protein
MVLFATEPGKGMLLIGDCNLFWGNYSKKVKDLKGCNSTVNNGGKIMEEKNTDRLQLNSYIQHLNQKVNSCVWCFFLCQMLFHF